MTGFRQLVETRGLWGCGEPAASGSSLALPGAARRNGSDPGLVKLARTIEAEVIPRLMLAHRAPTENGLAALGDPDPSTAEVAEFAEIVLEHDVSVASCYVDVLRARGLTLETIFLYLLAPTARLLGDLWKEDVLTFTDVTVGLARLQQLLRELSSPFENEVDQPVHGHRALIAPAPGEQHTFGMLMVEEFFRRAGWDVSGGPRMAGEVVQLVRREWYDVVGLSVSCDILLDELSGMIQSIRRASRNRGVGVLVGGRLFIEHPDFVARVGADATAVDGRQAILQLPRVLGLAARRC